jgi:hypothetical protein
MLIESSKTCKMGVTQRRLLLDDAVCVSEGQHQLLLDDAVCVSEGQHQQLIRKTCQCGGFAP